MNTAGPETQKNTFLEKVSVGLHEEDRRRINFAYWIAKQAHSRQHRKNGVRYFEHCKNVALTFLAYQPTTEPSYLRALGVVVALLHDVIEDTWIPEGLIAKIFWQEIENAVLTLSKCSLITNPQTGRIIRKEKKGLLIYFDAIAKAEKWVRRIKLADRIDNLRDAETMTLDWQKKYVEETRTYIIPIAEITDAKIAELLKNRCNEIELNYTIPRT